MMKQIRLLCAHNGDSLERHNGVKDDQRSIGIGLEAASFLEIISIRLSRPRVDLEVGVQNL